VPNARRAAEPGTMLGARQRAWWQATMRGSTATWKLWANSVPLMPLRFDLDALGAGLGEAVFTIDSWEGYQHERGELLRFLTAERVANVLSLTGDHHNNFAGLVPAPEPGAPAPAAELAVTGVSSTSVWQAFRGSVRPGDPRAALVVDSPAARGQAGPDRPALNVTWLWGARASTVLSRTGDVRAALAARNPRQNPHLRYCDSASNGIATAAVFADRVEAELVTIEAPVVDRGAAGARVLRRARFVVPGWRPGEGARMPEPAVVGEPPFPFDALGA
jgi:alkaline phosphatase D